jgi:two-component system, LytTR family, response regulator
MVIRTAIIEDEENSLQVLTGLISQFAPDLEVCGVAGHVADALKLVEAQKPDLVFMDVRLADGTSFDVLKRLQLRDFVLIVITAYDNYAIEAFRFSAIDYLLKPVGIPEFEEAVERARKNISVTIRQNTIERLLYNLGRQSGFERKINIPTINGYEFIDLKSIAWCESDGPYTTFHLVNKSRIVSSRHLGFYEELLENHNFCRIHNTTIINMQFVKSYIKGRAGHVMLTDGTRLEISQRRKTAFLSKLQL